MVQNCYFLRVLSEFLAYIGHGMYHRGALGAGATPDVESAGAQKTKDVDDNKQQYSGNPHPFTLLCVIFISLEQYYSEGCAS